MRLRTNASLCFKWRGALSPQNQNFEMLIRWVREYETRDDEFSLRRHRQLFAEFDGEKVEYTDNIQMPNKAMHPIREDHPGDGGR
jgi:hypothetical protein